MQGKPVELLPFLYLGSAHHACRYDYLNDLHITALLNVSRRDSRPAKGQQRYKWIPVEDSHTADISSHFQEAISFIGESHTVFFLSAASTTHLPLVLWGNSSSFFMLLLEKPILEAQPEFQVRFYQMLYALLQLTET